MDLFVFPSHTDTFGNVVLEALASGVPAIVTPDGGPRTIIGDSKTGRDGKIGRIVPDDQFAAAIAELINDPARLTQMRQDARAHALTASWDSVFEGIYAAYQELVPLASRSSAVD
jgi:glycosyltransferase involved in cell wall biosynthesis